MRRSPVPVEIRSVSAYRLCAHAHTQRLIKRSLLTELILIKMNRVP
jgi:hypothetical protein